MIQARVKTYWHRRRLQSVVSAVVVCLWAADPTAGDQGLSDPTHDLTPLPSVAAPIYPTTGARAIDGEQLRTAQAGPLVSGSLKALQSLLPQGEALPVPGEAAPRRRFMVPLAPPAARPDAHLDVGPANDQELVTISAREVPLSVVLGAIAQQHGLNVVAGEQVGLPISVNLTNVPLEDALYSILTVNGYTWHQHRDILVITPTVGGAPLPPTVQGRELRVFTLNFSSAAEIDRVVQGLLSPVGHSWIAETDSLDKRKTREQLVVEDLPDYLVRIEAYVAQADTAPRQVLVEAHILQVDLQGRLEHGVNLEGLFSTVNPLISLSTVGFADPDASPASFFTIDGARVNSLVEMLKTNVEAKTLAAPKVMVLNGQEARIQIGEQLGFFVTTTTQTSTLQDVQFLDVGVVLRVTPLISDDGRVLMSVKPEVSGGRINPDTSLPEEETTEVETTVMLNNGQGMVIGGLIKETDNELTSKVPYLGDMAVIGRVFQNRTVDKQRNEVIIALVPHIVPLGPCEETKQQVELQRVRTPLLCGPLCRNDRRIFEPELPDAIRNPINKNRPCPPQIWYKRPPPAIPHAAGAQPAVFQAPPTPGGGYTFPAEPPLPAPSTPTLAPPAVTP